MKINYIYILFITVSQIIMNQTKEWIPIQKSKVYRSVLDNEFCLYNMPGFMTKSIKCNSKYNRFINELEDTNGVKMNYLDHKSNAENDGKMYPNKIDDIFHVTY
jgi:hypothetical protein